MGLFGFGKTKKKRDVDAEFDKDTPASPETTTDDVDDLLASVETETTPETTSDTESETADEDTAETESEDVFNPETVDISTDDGDQPEPQDTGLVKFNPDTTPDTAPTTDIDPGDAAETAKLLDEVDPVEDTAGDTETAGETPSSWQDTRGRDALAKAAATGDDGDVVTIPDEVYQRARKLAETEWPEGAGPFDSQDVPLSFIAERDKPATPAVLPRHGVVDPRDDVLVRVWTNRAAFYMPPGSVVSEEREDATKVPTNTPAGQPQRYKEIPSIVDVLHIHVPHHEPEKSSDGDTIKFTVSLSIFSAPKTGKLWSDEGWEYSYSTLQDVGVDVGVVGSPWGIAVQGKAQNQQVYIVGVDGARWCVRATAYGEVLDDTAHDIVHSIVNSVVVHRGNAPMAPSTPMDLQIIDRRPKTDDNAETPDES